MSNVSNVEIAFLESSILKSGYSMLSEEYSKEEYEKEIESIKISIINGDMSNKHIQRASKLAQLGEGHSQFLTGIKVSCDVKGTIKFWQQMERYKFATFTSSMSSMHKIESFDIENSVCDKVNVDILNRFKKLQQESITGENDTCRLELLYSIPSGMYLTAGMTFNYLCLRNIYTQRLHHQLTDEWGLNGFCGFIESLPLAKELIINNYIRNSVFDANFKNGDIINNKGNYYFVNNNEIIKLDVNKATDLYNINNRKDRIERFTQYTY